MEPAIQTGCASAQLWVVQSSLFLKTIILNVWKYTFYCAMNTSGQAIWYLDSFVPIKNSAISWLWITQVEELSGFVFLPLDRSRVQEPKSSVFTK